MDRMEITGHWWVPGNEDRKFKGKLAIFPDGDGRILLECTETEASVLHGISDDDKTLITLNNLLLRQSYLIPFQSEFSFRTAFLGAHLPANNNPLFSQAAFSFDGLNCWINELHNTGTNISAAQSVLIDYPSYERDEYDFGNGIILTIYQGKDWNPSPNNFMHLAYPSPVPLKNIQDDIHKIRNLLVLLCDQPINLYFLQVGDKTTSIDVYSHALGWNEKPRNYRLIYSYHSIREKFQEILSNWLAGYENLKPSIYMLVGVTGVPHPFLESQFIYLMQGLEVFHRHTRNKSLMTQEKYTSICEILSNACPAEHKEWLLDVLKYRNEYPLKTRLKELFQEFPYFGSVKEASKLIHSVVSHRNYLMHGGKKEPIEGGRELLWRTQRLEALLKLCLLKELGFNNIEIAALTAKHRGIQFQLTTKFE